MNGIQQSLTLFGIPTFDDIIGKHPKYADIQVALNSRMRSSWNVTCNRETGKRVITVPAFVSDAPPDIKRCLLDWAALPARRTQQVKAKRRALEQQIWAWFKDTGRDTAPRIADPSRLEVDTQGTVYDLKEIRDGLNEQFFDRAVDSVIRWGRYGTTTSFQRHYIGPDGRRVSMITIAGVYDHPDVPRFAIEAVIYHEMLHVAIPPYKKGGRNIIHGPEFRSAERRFPAFIAWQRWEQTELHRIARAMRRKKRRATRLPGR